MVQEISVKDIIEIKKEEKKEEIVKPVHKGLEFTRQETQENYFFMLNL